MFKLYNTLTRRKQIFKPMSPGYVGLYTCGPTVYNYAHIGNLRTYIFEDILKRVLEYNGYKVRHVMNITDVGHLTSNADIGEDKMVLALRREGKPLNVSSMKEIANFYTRTFKNDIKNLNIIPPDIWCKATSHIKEMIELIKLIEKNGYAYETSDALYFDTAKLTDYGKLARLDIKGLRPGARVEINPEKKNPTDFALWFKAVGKAKAHVMQWASPWSKGWPGWHIECAAMSTKYLGQPFDIHCGGLDHIPVHHTNEIAQCEAGRGKPMANFWLHGEFLLLEKEKMAKTGEKFITLQTLIEKGLNPLAYRYFSLGAHYRSPLTFSWQGLEAAQNGLNNLYETISSAEEGNESLVKSYEKGFLSAINDDLDTPKALAITWDLIKSKIPPGEKMATLDMFDKVLGLDIVKTRKKMLQVPAKIKKLAALREKARREKNWSRADEIRKKIESQGYVIEDTSKGPQVRKKL